MSVSRDSSHSQRTSGESSKRTFFWINLARKAPLRGIPKNVLRSLADFANSAGTCFPSIGTLARESGWSERAVKRALRELEAGGWVRTKEGKQKGTVRQGSNVYTIIPRDDCQTP